MYSSTFKVMHQRWSQLKLQKHEGLRNSHQILYAVHMHATAHIKCCVVKWGVKWIRHEHKERFNHEMNHENHVIVKVCHEPWGHHMMCHTCCPSLVHLGSVCPQLPQRSWSGKLASVWQTQAGVHGAGPGADCETETEERQSPFCHHLPPWEAAAAAAVVKSWLTSDLWLSYCRSSIYCSSSKSSVLCKCLFWAVFEHSCG